MMLETSKLQTTIIFKRMNKETNIKRKAKMPNGRPRTHDLEIKSHTLPTVLAGREIHVYLIHNMSKFSRKTFFVVATRVVQTAKPFR